MIRELYDYEIKQMNKELIDWLKKELKGKYGMYVSNVVSAIRRLVEELKRNETKT